METIEDQGSRMRALAMRVRAQGALGRSDLMNRLFDFLLETSLAGRSPKEFEVAQEVFGKNAGFDMAQDASVRVYIHRLRKKLDELEPDAEGERLTIPRGEYRLAITRAASAPALPDPADDVPSADPPARRTIGARFLIAAFLFTLAIGAVLGAAASTLWSRDGRGDPLAATSFWRPLIGNVRPTVVAAGDYYIFGEAPDAVQVTRLVREFSINSREDLDQYVMNNPQAFGRYVDLDLHYLPVSVGAALREILPQLNAFTTATAAGRPRVITASRLTPETVKRSNIVYLGLLSGLGMLRDPLFEASGFRIGDSYDELIDTKSGRRFLSDADGVGDGTRKPRRDYAYLASFPGPTGNRILMVAGTRDPAVMQAAEVTADKAQLDLIARRAGNDDAFEALYEVSTVDGINVGSTLIVARPLRRADMWRAGRGQARFPDEAPSAAAAGTH